MDCRVKPGNHDGRLIATRLSFHSLWIGSYCVFVHHRPPLISETRIKPDFRPPLSTGVYPRILDKYWTPNGFMERGVGQILDTEGLRNGENHTRHWTGNQNGPQSP